MGELHQATLSSKPGTEEAVVSETTKARTQREQQYTTVLTLRVLAPYGNKSAWHTPYWIASLKTCRDFCSRPGITDPHPITSAPLAIDFLLSSIPYWDDTVARTGDNSPHNGNQSKNQSQPSQAIAVPSQFRRLNVQSRMGWRGEEWKGNACVARHSYASDG